MKLISSTLFCALAFLIAASAQDSLARTAKVQDSPARTASAQDPPPRFARAQDSLTRFTSAQDSLAPTARAHDSSARFAKVQDSLAKVQLKKAYIVDLLLKSPGMRPAMISTTFISRGQLEGNLKGKNILSSDFGQQRTEALLNLPVKNWGKSGMVTATILYARTNYQLSDIKGLDITESSLSKNTVGLTTTYRRVDSLFGRMFVSSASVVLLTGDGGGINKYAVMGNGMILLKKSAQTTLMVGIQVIIDPTNITPVIPLLVYQKQLPNGVDLNFTIPQQLTLRKTLSKNCWASFGTILSSSVSFFNYSSPNIPRNANFSTLDLKTGPGVEYKLGKLLLAGVSAGLWTPVMYRQYGRWEKSNRYFFDGKVDTTPYINLNLSLIPF
ncbi:hypothetical protein [[Flexibacter] sp. ATCC 35208]|uniref:hypothetical protein n=1 Tax=[Flexibacter] sp. ATCC 35208 TaxID=1936242 RepID=UPI0009CCB6B0|nr:hypothetical protein [[Flexibacter] sp. ATCC 35208]OMP78557.1 hypothetical protein BW716_13830 [[Flexibacter] sp. ATCC 35208]